MNKAILLMVIMVVACSYSTLAAWNNTHEAYGTLGWVRITDKQPFIDDFEYYNQTSVFSVWGNWTLNNTWGKNLTCVDCRNISSYYNEFLKNKSNTMAFGANAATIYMYKNLSHNYSTAEIIIKVAKSTSYLLNADVAGIIIKNGTNANLAQMALYYSNNGMVVWYNHTGAAAGENTKTPSKVGHHYYFRILINSSRVEYYLANISNTSNPVKANHWVYLNGYDMAKGEPRVFGIYVTRAIAEFDNYIEREYNINTSAPDLTLYPSFIYRSSRENDTNHTPTNFTFDWYNAKSGEILWSDTKINFNNTYRNNYSYMGTMSEQMYLNITMCDELGCAWEVSQTLYNLTSQPASPTILCANISNRYVNISVGNENYPLTDLLNASFEAYGRSTMTNGIDEYTFSWNGTAYNASLYLCLNYTTFNVTNTSFEMTYETDDGYKLRWYFNNINTSNCYNQTIYNFNTTTGQSDLRLTLRNVNTYGYYPDLFVKLQRLYVGEGVWRSVQDDKSDNYGLTHYYVYETTTDYKLLIYDKYNRLLASSDSMKFACTASICSLTYLVEPYDDSTSSSYDVDIETNYDNATGIVSIAFSDALGDNVHFWWTVSRETLSGQTVICNVSTYAASGNLTCNISGLTGTFLITARTSKSPWTDRVREWLYVHSWPLRTLLGGDDAGIYVVLIMLAVIGFGIWSPSVAITMVTIGLILLYALGMVSTITITLIIIAFIMAIIVGVKIKR